MSEEVWIYVSMVRFVSKLRSSAVIIEEHAGSVLMKRGVILTAKVNARINEVLNPMCLCQVHQFDTFMTKRQYPI